MKRPTVALLKEKFPFEYQLHAQAAFESSQCLFWMATCDFWLRAMLHLLLERNGLVMSDVEVRFRYVRCWIRYCHPDLEAFSGV